MPQLHNYMSLCTPYDPIGFVVGSTHVSLFSGFFFSSKFLISPLFMVELYDHYLTSWKWIEYHILTSWAPSQNSSSVCLSLKERFLADQQSLITVTLNLHNSCIPFQPCYEHSCWINKRNGVPKYHPPLHEAIYISNFENRASKEQPEKKSNASP